MFLKLSQLRWPRSSRYVVKPDNAADNSHHLPMLPLEIWYKIIRFTTRLAGHDNLDIDDAFGPEYANEEHPEIDRALFRDRRNMALVCSAWADLINEISAEYLVVFSNQQLKRLVQRLEMDKNSIGNRFGTRTTRIDFKILGEYDASQAAHLFRSTPNLAIYLNKNGPSDTPIRSTPIEVLHSLIAHCSQSLQRVDWAGPGEPPRFQDLAAFCNQLPKLKTLRLVAIYSYPRPPDDVPPIMRLPFLTTLSLGITPEPPVLKQHYIISWDPFLRSLSLSPQQLPALTRFECDLFPRQADSMAFLNVHGGKLRSLRTSTCFAGAQLPEAIAACANLVDLVISHGAEVLAYPGHHPTLKRVCFLALTNVKVEVPRKMFSNTVLGSLHNLLIHQENMVAPRLKEIRIRNAGGYSGVAKEEIWLLDWHFRWRLRGIEFVDQFGITYGNIGNRSRLDLVC